MLYIEIERENVCHLYIQTHTPRLIIGMDQHSNGWHHVAEAVDPPDALGSNQDPAYHYCLLLGNTDQEDCARASRRREGKKEQDTLGASIASGT